MRLSGPQASHLPRGRSRQRVVLLSLLIANLVAFVAQQIVQGWRPEVVPLYLGLSYRGIDSAYAWQFFSAALGNAGVLPFVGNVLVLYYLGRDLETILGERHFLFLYLLGIVAGELGHLFLLPAETVLLAASGGVAAVVVAFGTILPELELCGPLCSLFPVKLKAKYFAGALPFVALLLVLVDHHGIINHSAWLGGGAAGWLYVHLLGFGRASVVQRYLCERRREHLRRLQLSPAEVISEEIDPLLEKIAARGLGSLTRRERRALAEARARLLAPAAET